MALTNFPRPEARVLSMRRSSRDGLYALASAWQASNESNVRPFPRPSAPPTAGSSQGATSGEQPPYWPDGPSAA
ncbi:MAG TPA: hypothetical protein VNR90_10095 [Vicinamibacterales bacterium]|nr:hypothetical protein [Vicinamibacterales bacterium]